MPSTKQPHDFRSAYDSTAALRAAIPAADIKAANVDPVIASGAAVQAIPGIRELEPQMGSVLTKEQLHEVRRIETYALALHFAHVAYLATSVPVEPIQDLGEQASQARELLASDAAALGKRGLLDGSLLKELNNGIGYRNTAVDCQILVRLFRERWAAIEGKTAVTKKELDDTEALADRLASAANLRDRTSAASDAALEDRARAFTLLFRAYDHARRAATFLRWEEGDVDDYVPSLYAGRTRSKGGAAKGTTPQPPATATTATPTPPVAAVTTAPAAVAPPGNGAAHAEAAGGGAFVN